MMYGKERPLKDVLSIYKSKLIIQIGTPCVAIDVELPGKKAGWVSIDNVAASQEIAELLIKNGHRNILVISGKKNAAVNVERLTGVYAALENAGRRLTRDNVLYCDFSEEIAYNQVKGYLKENGTSKHTAFLCFSDIMALGAMNAVKECGYRVPEDFSITGFDGIPITEYTTPLLTTVAQDMKESGFAGAKFLHEIMTKKAEMGHIILPHRLLERGSVRNIAEGPG